MGIMSYEDKIRIQTFHEIVFGYWIIVRIFFWKRLEAQLDKKQSAYHFSSAS